MKFAPVQVVLKNGKTITIREVQRGDASAIINVVTRYITESPFLITTIDEFSSTIPEQKRRIQYFSDKVNSLLLVACFEKRVVASLDIRGEDRRKVKHNAYLGIGVLSDWQGCGVGKALLQQAVNWAKDCPSLQNLWLNVHAQNTAALHLYEKVGFRQAGYLKGYIKNRDGDFADDIVMHLPVG
ncbi:MAG: N-acetyltransferase [Niabella sp.]